MLPLINFNKILTWTDFPNSVAARKNENAQISATWKLDANQFERKGNAIVPGKYAVEVFLVIIDCGVKPEILSGAKVAADELLKHEQGHFDIIALAPGSFKPMKCCNMTRDNIIHR